LAAASAEPLQSICTSHQADKQSSHNRLDAFSDAKQQLQSTDGNPA